MLKKDIRDEIRKRKHMFSDRELENISKGIINKLMSNVHIREAQTILFYYSLSDEVNTHYAIEELRQQGKTILLPKVIGDHDMEICIYEGPSSLQKGSFYIMEPIGKPYLKLSDIETVVVPGMCFDSQGNRLGRGKGYYDRFLVKIPKAYKIGICFEFQKLDEIPTDKNDIQMNEVL